MMKKTNEQKEFNDNIKDYKLEIIQETSLIIFYALNAYLTSLINFGINSSVTKDCLEVIKEFTNINNYEKRILKFIKKNLKTIDLSVASDLIDEMSERKEEEIVYYYKVLDDIEDACSMRDEFRAKRIKKEYTSIADDECFLANVYASKYTVDDIMEYFSFKQDEIDYIKPRILEFLYDFEEDKDIFGVNYKVDENNVVTDIKLILPTIFDYETLMINVNLLMKASYLYLSYKFNIPINLEEYCIKSKSEEKNFDECFKKMMLTY